VAVQRAAQLDSELGTSVALPPAVAALLALADAQARRSQEACARAEGEVRTATLESTKLGEEKLALRERVAKRDQTIEDMRKEAQSDNRKLKKDRLVKATPRAVKAPALTSPLPAPHPCPPPLPCPPPPPPARLPARPPRPGAARAWLLRRPRVPLAAVGGPTLPRRRGRCRRGHWRRGHWRLDQWSPTHHRGCSS
jgi:hypothetical protein